jgi:hypothetical protein
MVMRYRQAVIQGFWGRVGAGLYGSMRPESLPALKDAARLYPSLKLVEIQPYRSSPLPHAVCMERPLWSSEVSLSRSSWLHVGKMRPGHGIACERLARTNETPPARHSNGKRIG